MCHNRYIEYTLMYIGYECISYECVGYVEYNEYSFMYFIIIFIFIGIFYGVFLKPKFMFLPPFFLSH